MSGEVGEVTGGKAEHDWRIEKNNSGKDKGRKKRREEKKRMINFYMLATGVCLLRNVNGLSWSLSDVSNESVQMSKTEGQCGVQCCGWNSH